MGVTTVMGLLASELSLRPYPISVTVPSAHASFIPQAVTLKKKVLQDTPPFRVSSLESSRRRVLVSKENHLA